MKLNKDKIKDGLKKIYGHGDFLGGLSIGLLILGILIMPLIHDYLWTHISISCIPIAIFLVIKLKPLVKDIIKRYTE